MSLTTDPNHPDLTHGVDAKPVEQAQVYLVISEEERAKGFIRPLRRAYVHQTCGTLTRMGLVLCETYARDPEFYSATYCCGCCMHLPVGEFVWDEDGEVLGS